MAAGLAEKLGLSNAERVENKVRETLFSVFGSIQFEQSRIPSRQQTSDNHINRGNKALRYGCGTWSSTPSYSSISTDGRYQMLENSE
jgi:hypothetical protein